MNFFEHFLTVRFLHHRLLSNDIGHLNVRNLEALLMKNQDSRIIPKS